ESKTVYKMVLRQFGEQALRFLKKNKTPKQFLRGVFISSFRFFRERLRVHRGVHQRCERCLQELSRDGIQSFALFGVGDEAETLYQLARDRAFQIQEVFDFSEGSRFHQLTVKPVEGLRSYPGQVVLGTQDQVDHRLKTLKELGVDAERIVVLW
ncbi:MAG: hypothetical protein GWM98_09480, partial [Nitrospinaceae bacterium]|nr:hypothetical protein [Nitrospinaceae bacterium]NIR54682.1 hypothetical protein [Nitrospinaceae bacterium]NIT81916.1 hypothetical protein [Nitrospinaceae bacterium]NIU44180.1 hypothetical protein [Nitrospinaceae bacterium]NIW05773.1 hypothetical protein [Nitrospinaceae bacterium]